MVEIANAIIPEEIKATALRDGPFGATLAIDRTTIAEARRTRACRSALTDKMDAIGWTLLMLNL
jgi:hypothetical protein